MKTTLDFLYELRTADVHLTADGERLLFDAPPGALTPNLRSEIVRRKPELLDVLRSLAACGARNDGADSIARVPRDEPLPLSYAQQRLWFLDRLHPGSHAYNIPAYFHLFGTVDVDALRRALDEIVRRHEALRTRFVDRDGIPVQEILPHTPVQLEVSEFPAENADAWQQTVDEEISREATRLFDLAGGRLLRAKLLCRNPREHVLLTTMHHIAADGWSLIVLVRELSELYNAYSTGREPTLPPLRIQYADFAVWQRQWLSNGVLEHQLRYWRRQLSEPLPALSISTDRPRPAVQNYDGEAVSVRLPRVLARAARALTERENTTLFAVLLAAYMVLLHQYSGQPRLSVGFPVANRNRIEIEPLIGFFVNTLIVRTTFAPETTYRDLIANLANSVTGAQDHQDLPYEKIVEEVQPQRTTAYNPLFQAMFSLNPPTPVLNLTGVQPAPLGFRYASSKFDVTLFVEESGDALNTILAYSTALFDAPRMRTMLGHYQSVLEWGISHLDKSVSALRLPVEPARPAVPAPTLKQPQADRGFEAPRSTMEQAIADVWKQVLKLDRLSVIDNFFDVGGHSLLVIQVQSQLSRLLNRSIPVVELFQFPTIRALADRLSGNDTSGQSIRAAYSRAHEQRMALARGQRAGKRLQ